MTSYAVAFGEQPGVEYWYRYRDAYTGHTPSIYLETFRVSSVTKKGVWLVIGYCTKKFVLRDAHKRWACPTEEEAMTSFVARKKRQRALLRGQLHHVEEVLELTEAHPNSKPVANSSDMLGATKTPSLRRKPDFKALEAQDWGR